MAIDPIGIPQGYGCPLYENSSVDEAQMVFVLEDTSDPNQAQRSAKALFKLGTIRGDVVLVPLPKKMSGYDSPVPLRLESLNSQFYDPLDFDHDPVYRPWDLKDAYTEAKTAAQDIDDLSKLFLRRLMMLKDAYLISLLRNSVNVLPRPTIDMSILSLSEAEEERYRSALQMVFANRMDAASEEDRVMSVLKHGSFLEVAQVEKMLEQEINRYKKEKLAEILSKYFHSRQDSLMETVQEHLGRRKIYVLCGREHAYINPATKAPYSTEVERLIKFLEGKQFKFAIVDASSDECIKPDSDRSSDQEQML